MNTCADCKYFAVIHTDSTGFGDGYCFSSPPIMVNPMKRTKDPDDFRERDVFWLRPIVWTDDISCTLFQPKEESCSQ